MKNKIGWLVEVTDTSTHILPLNDIVLHEQAPNCHCQPKTEMLPNGNLMLIHNSYDGREYIERLFDKDKLSDN